MEASRSVSAIVTCKGRLKHVRQTMPALVLAGFKEIIFVDYNCPEKSGKWVKENFPSVQVINDQTASYFSLPKARNLGAQHAKSDWLFFLDADVIVNETILREFESNVHPACFYLVADLNLGSNYSLWGSVLMPRTAFFQVGGYDEVITGWGG